MLSLQDSLTTNNELSKICILGILIMIIIISIYLKLGIYVSCSGIEDNPSLLQRKWPKKKNITKVIFLNNFICSMNKEEQAIINSFRMQVEVVVAICFECPCQDF